MSNISTTAPGFPSVIDSYTAAVAGNTVPSLHYNGLAAAVIAIEKHTIGLYNARTYGVLGDGSDEGTAISAFLDVVSATGGTAYFGPGTYTYTTSPNFARNGVHIVADPAATFVHTGSGNAFVADGGTGFGLYGLRFENITVQGNASSTHTFYIRSVHHSRLVHLNALGCSTTGHAFHMEACLANTFDTPRCSTNEGTVSPLPLHGMYFTRKTTGGNVDSNANTIMTPVFEGLTGGGGAGIYFDWANSNKVLGGTSEGNTNGIYISQNGHRNAITGIDLESNTTNDIYIESSYNFVYGVNATGTVRITSGSGSWNSIIGGLINQLTLDTNAAFNTIVGVTTGSTGGSLTDAGATNNYKANNYDGVNGRLHAESAKRTSVVVTASLPAASASMDGTFLLENVGAGDRNLIIYAGGQRFRIDGGAAF